MNKRVRAIAMASRQKGAAGEERRKQSYRELLRLSHQLLNEAERVTSTGSASDRITLLAPLVWIGTEQTCAWHSGGCDREPGKP